jgi:hypothetical protein
MNIDEAVAKACLEPTLLDALTWIAVWESERAIQQAKKFFETGERTGSNGAGWDTCFKVCFEKVMQTWKTPSPADADRHLEALKEILESAKTTGEDMSHLWLIERIGKALRAPGKIEERRNAAPEMEYLVGQRLAPGLVVAPESIAEKLALVEKMNADNAKMRGEYLKEKQKLELQVRAVVDLVPHTVGAHTEGFPCDGCLALKKLGIERTSIFENRNCGDCGQVPGRPHSPGCKNESPSAKFR